VCPALWNCRTHRFQIASLLTFRLAIPWLRVTVEIISQPSLPGMVQP
jgi:hypothetical protein